MTEIPSSEFEFLRLLINELERLDIFLMSEFRIPGTRTRVDVYIASPVRAFVEIKLGGFSKSSNVQRVLHQLEQVRRKFGGEIAPVMIVGGEPWHSSPITKKLRDSGFLVLSLDDAPPRISPVTYCAKEIYKFLSHLPYKFTRARVSTPTRMFSGRPVESRLEELEFSGELVPATAIFTDVLISLKSILDPAQFDVLEQELLAFSEEYFHEHYTACALRIGRTLEHVVYTLARAWGVNVNRTTLQILSGLDHSFEQLSNSVIAYAASRYRRTGKSKLLPLNVTSCGFSSLILSTNDVINSFSDRSPTWGAPKASTTQ